MRNLSRSINFLGPRIGAGGAKAKQILQSSRRPAKNGDRPRNAQGEAK